MKKTRQKEITHRLRREKIRKKLAQRKAGIKKGRKYKKHNENSISNQIQLIRKKRRAFEKKFYKTLKYKKPKAVIKIDGHFGIEKNFMEFVEISSSFMGLRSKWTEFELANCIRLWPSGITQLCSFRQWTEITSTQDHQSHVASTDPLSEDVNSYLTHCGFYEYVNRKFPDSHSTEYSNHEIVKIKRERDGSEIESREDEINALLRKYSLLTEDELELFDCTVLIEAFNNITEHGRSYKDNGWWTITQYHKTTGIISMCLADNGIGIKNSLLTGPQGDEVRKKCKDSDDSAYINLALNENISGAVTASIKDDYKLIQGNLYRRGSRRGNGLHRIKETCRTCGVEFSILSQNSFINIHSTGKIKHLGAKENRIFAGTMYHFIIPAKRVEINHEKN